MRKFYVSFYNEYGSIVTTTIDLEPGEKANEVTFHAKINERYLNDKLMPFCILITSWSLIEE